MQPPQPAPRNSVHGLLDWLLEGFEHFNPQEDLVFFDAPGAPSRGQSATVVEVPWALSRYRRERHVLDVGTVYRLPWYYEALDQLGASELVGLDLQGRDLARPHLPLGDGQFSLVVCLSYLTELAAKQGTAWAMAELYRVLMPQGRLLLSLPLGPGFCSHRVWLETLTGWEVLSLRYFCHHEGWVECYPDQAFAVPESETAQALGCVELWKP